jgi:DNA mismatch repair protein MutS2
MKAVKDEIDLHRLTVDEALMKLDKYLHDAFTVGFDQVVIVHGKGAGTLRQAVRRELSRHPLVQSFRPGGRYEGGADGVTVVELSSK